MNEIGILPPPQGQTLNLLIGMAGILGKVIDRLKAAF